MSNHEMTLRAEAKEAHEKKIDAYSEVHQELIRLGGGHAGCSRKRRTYERLSWQRECGGGGAKVENKALTLISCIDRASMHTWDCVGMDRFGRKRVWNLSWGFLY